MPRADNTRFLVEASRHRSQQARRLAEQAITAAGQRGQRPSVAGIARTAGVSRSWLYTQGDLIQAINRVRIFWGESKALFLHLTNRCRVT
jgi:hypothetical protein